MSNRQQAKKRNRSGAKGPRQKRRSGSSRKVVLLAAAALTAALVLGFSLLGNQGQSAVASPIEFTDVEVQTHQFMEYNKTIKLTPEQELVKQKALSQIKAPCCSDNSALTCCCPCNMAKSWWGLSNHLIADEGYGAEEVRAAVEGWLEFINPGGFTGNACYTGGCKRPFERNGCGGMDEENVLF